MAQPKDIQIVPNPRIIKDKLVTFGKHKGKLFSQVLQDDLEYCLQISDDCKNYREFSAYIDESKEMEQHEDRLEQEEAQAALEQQEAARVVVQAPTEPVEKKEKKAKRDNPKEAGKPKKAERPTAREVRQQAQVNK